MEKNAFKNGDFTAEGKKNGCPLLSVWICGLAGLLTTILLWPAPGRAMDIESSVQQAVSAWRQAWMDKDLEQYAAFYSKSFFASEQDRRVWLQRKSKIFGQSSRIQVEFSDLQVVADEGRAIVSFTQHYRGPGLSDIGYKTVSLRLEEGNWRILGEDWSPVEKTSGKNGNEAPPEPEVEEKPATPEVVKTSIPPVKKWPRAMGASELPPFTLGLWTGERSEHVCVRLDRPFEPKVTPDDPKARRFQVDISNVHQWTGPDQVFDGRWVRQITSYMDTRTGTLRIVVEVEPDSECVVTTAYIESDHLFCLDFAPPGRENDGRKGYKKPSPD